MREHRNFGALRKRGIRRVGERLEAETSTMADKQTIKLLRETLSLILAGVFYDHIHVLSNRLVRILFRDVNDPNRKNEDMNSTT